MVTKTEKAYIKSAIPNDEVSEKILEIIESFDSGGGSGAASEKYTKTILMDDWTGPSANEYKIVVTYTFHGILNPTVTCYETNGAAFDQVLLSTSIDANNDITITVNQIPDARFVGKIVID
jgi:hypothetical protein